MLASHEQRASTHLELLQDADVHEVLNCEHLFHALHLCHAAVEDQLGVAACGVAGGSRRSRSVSLLLVAAGLLGPRFGNAL